MKQRASLFALILLSTIAVFTGCNPDKPVTSPFDETAPEIFMSNPKVVTMGNYDHYFSSDSIAVDIRFEDDMALKSFEITVKYNQELSYMRVANDPWSETIYGQLEGLVDGYNALVFIPWDPNAGPYEFTVKCWDEDDHMTELKTYLFVSNRQDVTYPAIEFTSPDTNMVDTFLIGQNIPIKANTYDPPGSGILDDVKVYIRNNFTHETLPGGYMVWDSVWLGWALDTIFNVPAGTAPGVYTIDVYGKDFIQNVTKKSDTIYIKPF